MAFTRSTVLTVLSNANHSFQKLFPPSSYLSPVLYLSSLYPLCSNTKKKKREEEEADIFFEAMEVLKGTQLSSLSVLPPPEESVPNTSPYDSLQRLARMSPVVVFSGAGCCMCHVIKQLLLGLGVAPTVHDLDAGALPQEIRGALFEVARGSRGRRGEAIPAVFVGGKYLGGIERVMGCHINGTLVPLLKDAGALWL